MTRSEQIIQLAASLEKELAEANATIASLRKQIDAKPPVVVPVPVPPAVVTPVVTTPSEPGKLPPRIATKLTEPFKIIGARIVENWDIDASGVDRVFDLTDGCNLTVRNCTIKNATSVIEKDVLNTVTRFENVHVAQTTRYGFYLGSQFRNDKEWNRVYLIDSSFQSSTTETPLRFMQGVAVIIDNTIAIDTIDIGGDKNEQGARFHCWSVIGNRFHSGNWTLFGPETDGKNKPTDCTQLIEFTDSKFDGGARLGKGIKTVRFTGCEFDATKNDTGWALNKHYAGVTQDVKLDLRATGCKFIGGQVERLGKFADCTLNGKAI